MNNKYKLLDRKAVPSVHLCNPFIEAMNVKKDYYTVIHLGTNAIS